MKLLRFLVALCHVIAFSRAGSQFVIRFNNPFFLKGDLKSTPAKALLYDVDLQTAPMCRCARI